MEGVSTPIENTVIIGYFSQIISLIEFWACNWAGSVAHVFSPFIISWVWMPKANGIPLLNTNAISSENPGGIGVCSGCWKLRTMLFFYTGECVYGCGMKMHMILACYKHTRWKIQTDFHRKSPLCFSCVGPVRDLRRVFKKIFRKFSSVKKYFHVFFQRQIRFFLYWWHRDNQ